MKNCPLFGFGSPADDLRCRMLWFRLSVNEELRFLGLSGMKFLLSSLRNVKSCGCCRIVWYHNFVFRSEVHRACMRRFPLR